MCIASWKISEYSSNFLIQCRCTLLLIWFLLILHVYRIIGRCNVHHNGKIWQHIEDNCMTHKLISHFPWTLSEVRNCIFNCHSAFIENIIPENEKVHICNYKSPPLSRLKSSAFSYRSLAVVHVGNNYRWVKYVGSNKVHHLYKGGNWKLPSRQFKNILIHVY